MKKIIFLAVMLTMSILTYSQTFTVNGINYNKLSQTTVEVGLNPIVTDTVIIPETVANNDTAYTVVKIASNAFSNCFNLTRISLPNTLELIGQASFYHCNLDSVNVPDSVYRIELYAFSTNLNLKHIKLPFKLLTIESAVFDNCAQLKTVMFNSNLETIQNVAFSCCYELDSISLPESTINISDSAFFNCGLSAVSFAPIRINNMAFGDCFNLSKIYSHTETPPIIMENSFLGVSTNAQVFVCGNIVDYQNTTWGTVFNDITNAPTNLCNSSLISITPENEKLTIYPNPVKDEFITIKSPSKELKVAYVYNINGTLTNSILFRDFTKFNIQKPGIYYIKINNIVKKIIKL